MKYFTARDRPPAEYSLREVRRLPVSVGISGFRYGSPVLDDPERSYTELEFDAAAAEGLERLVFLLDENAASRLPTVPVRSQTSSGSVTSGRAVHTGT